MRKRTHLPGLPLLFAGLLCVGATGCVHARRGALTDEDGPRVEQVTVSGLERVDEDDLLDGLVIRPPSGILVREYSTYDPVAVDVDRRRVDWFLREQGLYDARVEAVEVRRPSDDAVTVHYTVREGAPARVVSVDLKGFPERVAERVSDRVRAQLRLGDVFLHQRYLKAKRAARGAMLEAGYAHARLDGEVRVDRDAGQVRIRLRADPGPRVRFGRVEVVGIERVPREAVTARVAWEPGEVYAPTEIETTRGRLHQLGVFRTVGIRLKDEGRPETADVVIEVQEEASHRLRLGAGFGVDRIHWLIRGRADYTHVGFLLPLLTLQLNAQPGYSFLRETSGQGGFVVETQGSLSKDDFLLPRLRGVVQVNYGLKDREAYSSHGPRLHLGLERPFLDDRLGLAVAWGWTQLSFPSVDDALTGPVAERVGLYRPYRLGTLEQKVSYDLRDDPLDPRQGAYFELLIEEGGRFAGGGPAYVKIDPEARGYLGVFDRLVIAARVHLGTKLFGRHLPLTRRYYSGGAASQRGFSQRRLSPRARLGPDGQPQLSSVSGVPVGGQALLESNLELRLDVIRVFGQMLGVTAFVDGADVNMSLSDIGLDALHWAVGGGLRLKTPVGPIRLDVGVRLTRLGPGEPDPNDKWAFHLSLGEAF